MSDTPAQTAEKPPKRRRLRRWLLLILVVVVLLIGGPIGYVLLRNHILAVELQATIDELDKTDPGWRLEEIKAARPPLPDDKNGALQVLAAHRLMPEYWESELDFEFDNPFGNHPSDFPPPVRLNQRQVEIIRKGLAKARDAVIAARNIRNYSTGRYNPQLADDYYSTKWPESTKVREIIGLLKCDALLLAHENQVQQAWQSAEAIYRTGTSGGIADSAGIFLLRLDARTAALQSMERILGQGVVSTESLSATQQMLEKSLDEPLLWAVMRGERGGMRRFFIHHEKTGLTFDELNEIIRPNGKSKTGKSVDVRGNFERLINVGTIRLAHTEYLKFMTKVIAAAKLPVAKRVKRVRDLEEYLKYAIATNKIPHLTGAVTPFPNRFCRGNILVYTRMQCAIAALACERFRLERNRWPKDLNELVSVNLISMVPIYAYDQKPIRYKVSENGISVYSRDEFYDGYKGQLLNDLCFREVWEQTIAFHLWNPERRRQPPLPAGFRDFYQKDIWTAGKDGYHVYGNPALITTKNGTTLAFCEGRKNKDDKATDLLVKRSTDGGFNWSEHKIVSSGDNRSAIGNPCCVSDQKTGMISLLFTRNQRDVFVTHSKDEGITWKKPVNITESVSKKDWVSYVTGPGAGIQILRGRGPLLIPCHHRTMSGDSHAHVIVSDDGGKTWKLGGVLPKNTAECQVVEKVYGGLMLSVRCLDHQNDGAKKRDVRAFAYSTDRGATWGKIKSDEKLLDCKGPASFIRLSWPDEHDYADGLDGFLVFASPVGGSKDLTIQLSDGDELKWVASRILNRGPSGISSLVRFKDRTVGCLYESGDGSKRKIRFARCTLDWVRTTPER